jgi:hypothetical protein
MNSCTSRYDVTKSVIGLDRKFGQFSCQDGMLEAGTSGSFPEETVPEPKSLQDITANRLGLIAGNKKCHRCTTTPCQREFENNGGGQNAGK